MTPADEMSNEYFPVTGHLENFNKEIEKLSNFSVRYLFLFSLFVRNPTSNRSNIIASKVLFYNGRWLTRK